MQSIPGYPADVDAAEPSAVVSVNGVPLDVESVTVSRELSSSLPEQVTSVSGITAATGSVSWNVGADVTDRAAQPWSGSAFPPKPADTVTVDMGYGNALARQMTGVIDSSSGSIADGDVTSEVVDPIDKLNRSVSFPAHMSVMPPWDENGSFLTVNNSPIFTTDRVLRACAFNATPPVDPGCILSVPLMGSAWPEVGRFDSGSQNGFPTFPPSFSQTQWGLGVNSINANYTPDLSNWPTGRLDKNLQITLKARNTTGSAASSTVRANWGADYIQLAVSSSRNITASIRAGGVVTTVCTMTSPVAWSADVFTLRVNPGGGFSIYANNGATVTGTVTLPASMTGANMSLINITTPHQTGVHIGGVQVGFSTSPTWSRPCTAVLTPSASNLGLPVMRRIDNRVALDVLKEQAEAECAAHWIDEYGVYRWVNRDILTSATPIATLTALDDVFDLGWDSDAKGVRSDVVVASDEWSISRSPVSNQTLWQGSGASLESGQTDIEFAEPEADIEWFAVNTLLRTAGNWSSNPDYFNRGIGTFTGGILVDDTAEAWLQTNVNGYSAALERVGLFAYKFTTNVGTFTGTKTAQLQTFSKETDSAMRSSRRSMNLPLLRGKGRAEAMTRYTTGANIGPANAARLEHDAGSWVQDPAALQDLADWLSTQVATPRPVLRDLDVVPDPRRQLGDIVWVEGGDVMSLRLRVLITSLSLTVSAGSMEQSIGGRVLEAINPVTNEQFDLFHAGRTNTQLDSLWAGGTNAQLDADPLGRG